MLLGGPADWPADGGHEVPDEDPCPGLSAKHQPDLLHAHFDVLICREHFCVDFVCRVSTHLDIETG